MKANSIKHFLSSLSVGVTLFALQTTALAQAPPSDTDAQLKNALQMIERLASQVAAQEARIADLEAERRGSPAASPEKAAVAVPAAPVHDPGARRESGDGQHCARAAKRSSPG